MLIRALAIAAALLVVSVSLTRIFGVEILVALGLLLTQLKVIAGKSGSFLLATLPAWIKMQGANFLKIELAKHWVTKSLLPMLIGAGLQRRISGWTGRLTTGFRARSARLGAWYRDLSPGWRVLGIGVALLTVLALSVTSLGLWLFVFSVQVPIWIAAAFGTIGRMLWQSGQKMAFRAVAFMQLYRIWGLVRRRLPPEYLDRKRRFDYRIARIVVRRRRLTVAQLHARKHGLALRWALLREYLRHRRPMPDDSDERTSPR